MIVREVAVKLNGSDTLSDPKLWQVRLRSLGLGETLKVPTAGARVTQV